MLPARLACDRSGSGEVSCPRPSGPTTPIGHSRPLTAEVSSQAAAGINLDWASESGKEYYTSLLANGDNLVFVYVYSAHRRRAAVSGESRSEGSASRLRMRAAYSRTAGCGLHSSASAMASFTDAVLEGQLGCEVSAEVRMTSLIAG